MKTIQKHITFLLNKITYLERKIEDHTEEIQKWEAMISQKQISKRMYEEEVEKLKKQAQQEEAQKYSS